MKRNLIFTAAIVLMSISVFAQQEKLEFTQKKIADEGFTVYFHVVNLEDATHANTILEELLNDNNIYGGRYFKSGTGNDRFQIYINEIVSAEYVRNILLTYGVDYEFTCVSIDGNLEELSNGYNGSTKTYVSSMGFPKYERSGNKEGDDINYRNEKDQWINENPEEYNKLLEELEESSPEKE